MTADADSLRKWRRIRAFQRYALNPPAKIAVWLGLVPRHAVLETRGRTTGTPRRVPVGVCVEGDVAWIVSEHGERSGYVRNLLADPHVRLRIRGRWREGRATTLPDDDPLARLDACRWFPGHASTVRRAGTSLLTVRVDLADHG